jgi:hypothetical protein
MPFSEVYRKQAASSYESCPKLSAKRASRSKGGTGINLFIRDMPRGYEAMAGLLLFYSRH